MTYEEAKRGMWLAENMFNNSPKERTEHRAFIEAMYARAQANAIGFASK